MSKNYYENDAKRQKRKKKTKKNSAGKVILLIIALVVISLASFVVTLKIAKPDYDFSQLVPQKVMDVVENPRAFIDEKIWNITTTEAQTTTEATTLPTTTTKPMMDYIEDSDFKFKTSVQGSQVGNLLNGGLVGTDSSYIYYYVKGSGIYRFGPSSESYALYYGIADSISSINLRGDYIYYVNNKDSGLYKLKKGTSNPTKIADGANFAYVYDSTVYFTTTTGKICVMDAKNLVPVTAYYANGNDLHFVGISLSRVFFTVTDFSGNVEYLSVDTYGHTKPYRFREDTNKDEIRKMQLENGFFYYYLKQGSGEYNLVRQKFGSSKIVTLAENVSTNNYAEVDSNRVYYSIMNNGSYLLKELNMNSNARKTMLSANNVKSDNSLSFFLGGEYQFIIGEKGENEGTIYKASSIYTSSTNAMELQNGKWRY